MTDALRTMLLRAQGYDTTAMEFVPSAHTPKNTLLRARKRHTPSPALLAEYLRFRDAISAPALALERELENQVALIS